MRQLRLLVIAVGCLIAGPILVFRSFVPLPSLEKLEKVSGIIQFDTETRSRRFMKTQYPVIIVGEPMNRFKYLDWFPNAHTIKQLVRAGNEATIWTDRSGNGWVWQIEQDGDLIVPYANIHDAVSSNQQFDWLLGGVVFIIGIFSFVMFYRQRTRGA